jgi:DNA-binding response OmpR family regulator
VTALECASSGDFDLMVLDVGLPRMDGFTVLRVLRTMDHHLPIIMCTARDAVQDTVAGLEGGADDYLAKPFKFEELLARVRTRLRPQPGTTVSTTLSQGSLSLDLTTRIAVVEGREVELSAREFAMAREFLEHPGQVLSREQLLSRVWGYDFDGASNVVDVYVRYLCTKARGGPVRHGPRCRLPARHRMTQREVHLPFTWMRSFSPVPHSHFISRWSTGPRHRRSAPVPIRRLADVRGHAERRRIERSARPRREQQIRAEGLTRIGVVGVCRQPHRTGEQLEVSDVPG